MCHSTSNNDEFLHKFRQLYRNVDGQKYSAAGGIFTTKTRERLLGIKRQSGRGITKSRFWKNQSESVMHALLDIQLFIARVIKDPDVDIEEVINPRTFNPIISELLPYRDHADSNKARIAYMMIEQGFSYLRDNQDSYSDALRQQITEAIDLGKHLAHALLPQSERYGFRLGDHLGHSLEEGDNE